MRNKFGVDLGASRIYERPYDDSFDSIPYPIGWRVLDIVKFNEDDKR